jgi:hypothetical protein
MDEFYLYKFSDVERHALNLVVRRLLEDRAVATSTLLKAMSGLRLESHGNRKIRLSQSKRLIWVFHKQGIITCLHGKVRLGNILLYSGILDEESRNILIRKLGSLHA